MSYVERVGEEEKKGRTQEDDKTLDMIEPLLQEVLEYIIRNYDKLGIASIVFADKIIDP